MAFAALAMVTVASVVAVQMFAGEDVQKQRDRALDDSARPVVLERFDLSPRRGKSRGGLAEFIRRDGKTYLRMIAAGLRQNYGDEVYQASLAGKREQKLLGSQKVGAKGLFLGQAEMSSDDLHSFSRIELRLVGANTSESGRLILRGKIPG